MLNRPLSEAPLNARAHRAQEPGGGCRQGEANGGHAHASRLATHETIAEQLEPERQECIWQRRQLRQHEGGEHEARFVPVAQLAESPHRRQRRRQIVARFREHRR